MSDETVHVLYAEDDPDDRLLAREAWAESRALNPLQFAVDGQDLLDYLRREGAHAGRNTPQPGVILLDLNMPRMDGRTALAELKKDPDLRRIPVVILTTSKAHEDVLRSYDLGVAGFVVKPPTFESLASALRHLGDYWLELVRLPQE
ncbi:MAG: response regulator [bacterium]|nr:response regulator [bacterium]